MKRINQSISTNCKQNAISLNDYFDLFLKTEVFKNSQGYNFETTWLKHIQESIGLLDVKSINVITVKSFLKELHDKNFSKSYIRNIYDLLKKVIMIAFDDQSIYSNLITKINISNFGREAKVVNALSLEQELLLFKILKTKRRYERLEDIIKVFLDTGLRSGELRGLTWDCIDFNRNTLTIKQQLIFKHKLNKQPDILLSSPKTLAGRRVIPMTERVCLIFKKLKKENSIRESYPALNFYGYKGSDFVFLSKNGFLYTSSNLNLQLNYLKKSYNDYIISNNLSEDLIIEQLSCHVFRHTACTKLIKANINIKVVQKILGHKSINTTMQVYNHIATEDFMKNEMKKLDFS